MTDLMYHEKTYYNDNIKKILSIFNQTAFIFIIFLTYFSYFLVSVTILHPSVSSVFPTKH